MQEGKIFYRLDERDRKLLDDIKEITLTNYGSLGDFLDVETLWNVIEDLKAEYDGMEEKYEDLVRDVEDNYERIPYDEQV